MKARVRVLVVDDSPIVRSVLCALLARDPEIEVIGTAENGRVAVAKTAQCRPDVILMDIHMPVMDGLQATRAIMASSPCPIIIVSSAANREDARSTFDALSAGALDILEKPAATVDWEGPVGLLARKIKLFSGIPSTAGPPGRQRLPPASGGPGNAVPIRLVAIGASTGGPAVLRQILAPLPPSFPLGIVIVQHFPHGFVDVAAEWLRGETSLRIKKGVHGAVVEPGTVHLAPGERNLEVINGGRLVLSLSPLLHKGACQSVDLFFSSAARACGPATMGILLTGMGEDGALGLKAIRKAGGLTIAQNRETCAVYGMPKAAVDIEAASEVMTPARISTTLLALTGNDDAHTLPARG